MTTTTLAASDALVAAVDGLIWTALTIAGTKLRHSSRLCPRRERWWAYHVEPATLHTRLRVDRDDAAHLLDGVWKRVPEVARRHEVDPDCLTQALAAYTQDLLVAGEPYAHEHVPRLLRRAPCMTGAGDG